MCTVCTYGAAIFFLKFVNASFSVHIAEKSQQCCMVLLGPKIILNLRIKNMSLSRQEQMQRSMSGF